MDTAAAADQKEVSLTLSSPSEAKALSRGTTRRRRSRKEVAEDGMLGMTGGGNVLVERTVPTETLPQALPSAPVPVPAPAPVVPTFAPAPAPVPAAPIIPVVATPAAPSVPIAPMASTTAVGGGVVRIQAKRVGPTGSLNPPPSQAPVAAPHASAAPKILHHKKRPQLAPAAAQTFKKPRFLVTPKPDSNSGAPGGELKKTRKFSERKISITVKPAAQTRRMRRTLKHRIHTMPIGAVHKYLLRKGVLKPKATAPPEDMMRSMMRDYLLLHAAE